MSPLWSAGVALLALALFVRSPRLSLTATFAGALALAGAFALR